MKKEQFLKLLSKKLSGEISGVELEMLKQAVESSNEYRQLAGELDHYFYQHKTLSPKIDQLQHTWEMIVKTERDNSLGKFNYSLPKKTPFYYKHWLKVAAILVLLMGSGIVGYQIWKYKADQGFNTLAATNQKIFSMLDDGTKIWLNKKSTISYSKAFGKHKREIFLDGEAYFDVVKNTAIPLFIHVGNIDVEVKGTAFTINAYRNNPEIQVALIRGSIQVTNRLNKNDKVLLKPNEKLIFLNRAIKGNQNSFLVVPMDTKASFGTSDTLLFYKEKLKDLVLRMEKKYDLKIEIQSEQLKGKRFSGTFTDETIQQALEALQLSYPLTYTINGKLIVIKD